MRLIISCLLGLEASIKNELVNLNYPEARISAGDGQVILNLNESSYDEILEDIAKLNLYLRTGERVLLELGSKRILEYDDLFNYIKSFPWEDYVPEGFFVEVKFYSLKSKIFGEKASRAISKKAIVSRLLSARYITKDYIDEDKDFGRFRVHLAFRNDILSLSIDTSGVSLYKRGYRMLSGAAPIRETLAAAILYYSKYSPFSDELLYDPFCGSGTFAIEAAMLAANMPPGINRKFAFEQLPFFKKEIYSNLLRIAKNSIDIEKPADIFIYASDIDSDVLDIARHNASLAGVSDFINFYQADFLKERSMTYLRNSGYKNFLVLTNPPYGERLSERSEVRQIHRCLAARFTEGTFMKKGVRLSVITSDNNFEADFSYKADKRRKLYNGMKETCLYHYFRQSYK